MELTCTSFSFPLLPFERSLHAIALLGIGAVDLGAHLGATHLQPDRIGQSPQDGQDDAGPQAPRPATVAAAPAVMLGRW